MKQYDIIIIGAGIAGCSLAYNLKNVGHNGSILLIDKDKIGANKGYGYRNTFKSVIDEYNLPYIHTYKGLKIGSLNEEITTLDNEPFYGIDYAEVCNYLFSNSDAEFINETAEKISKNTIQTDKSTYSFRILIDCSGPNLFLKRKLKMPLPIKYFVGELMEIDNSIGIPSEFCQFNVDNNGFLEDIYPFEDKILYGIWKYSKKIDFSSLNDVPKDSFYMKMGLNEKKLKKYQAIQTVSPAFPLVSDNYAFLGDSCGSATPSAGEGIEPILNASRLLSQCIKVGNLSLYEKKWKETNMDLYIRHLAFKMNVGDRIKMIKLLKNDKQVCYNILRNRKVTVPEHVKRSISIKSMVSQAYYYNLLKFYYWSLGKVAPYLYSRIS